MEKALLQDAIELTEQIMRAHYCRRDISAVLAQLAPDVSWIGPGEMEKKYTLEEIQAHFMLGQDAIPTCEVSVPDLRAVELGEDYCLVTGSMTIRTKPDSGMLLEVDQRVSFTFRHEGGRLEVVHMHISNPYGEMDREEYFPSKIGSQSYRYLQSLLKEKTEVLDMIAGNINGGLKGSNDDSTFSFFYVNEGLPRMLGYTYDEFMEKSGGTATGAVYPPDLPAALEACARCFAKGPVYSAEYRIEKKDGSLMWVLDSGRKAVDSEGVTRINSIIMDITPLKQALFDLEVERERYRIALEHTTGAMCEYDVAQDRFSLFPGVEGGGGQTIKCTEIPNFSQKITSGALADEEDGAALLARCTGRSEGMLELRAHLPDQGEGWYWVQFSCSVLFDHTGAAVRAIGMLKDITQEKESSLELLNRAQRDGLTGLLNQTAVKETIQAHLDEQDPRAPRACALLMVDLDRFKEVNDVNGHAYGDEVLVQTARILEEVAGDDGVAGRIGGDEFLVMVHQAQSAVVARMADEIVHRVREIGVEKGLSLSCSVGIAYCDRDNEDFLQMFDRADRALYRTKNDGRDGFFME